VNVICFSELIKFIVEAVNDDLYLCEFQGVYFSKNVISLVFVPVTSCTRLIQKVSTVLLEKKLSKVSYKILLVSDSAFLKLFFHIFAAIMEALIVAGHKFLYTLLIECGRLQC